MRYLFATATFAAIALSACTTTQRADVKEGAKTAGDRTVQAGEAVAEGAKEAWHDTKEAAGRAYDKATRVPPHEREKKAFEVRQESRLRQLAIEAEGIEKEADIYDIDDRPAFERAVGQYEQARKDADQKLARVQSSDVKGWEKGRRPVDESVEKVHASVKKLRDLVHQVAH